MKISVKRVETNKDLRNFVEFPNKLYKNNKYYVPQLIQSDIDSLSPRKNHAFDFCEAIYWLAYRNNKIVGRIAGIINHEYNRNHGKKYIRFGFVDFIDDEDVVNALFCTFEEWAKSQNAEYLCGPLGFLEFDISGLLIEGFDQLATAYGKYNAQYYSKHIERLGYTKNVDWVEYEIYVPEQRNAAIARIAEHTAQKSQLTLLQFTDRKELCEKYANKIFALLNREYARVYGYTTFTEGQIENMKKQFIPLLNLKYVTLVADKEDNLIAFAIFIPSLSKAFQKAKGHLFPFGFIHILRALHKNDSVDSLLMAVATEYQNLGVPAMMLNKLWQQMHDNGVKILNSTREWEDNLAVRKLCRHYDHKLNKRARCYIKEM